MDHGVVFVAPSEENADDEGIEIPLEEDQTVSLKVVQSLFANAAGLRFRAPDTGRMRALKMDEDGKLYPPVQGWDGVTFIVVFDKKRTREEEVVKIDSDSKSGGGSSGAPEKVGDLIILGLNYKATEDDVKTYFKSYGEVKTCEIKKDYGGNSRGFGFVSFMDDESAKRVMTETYHTILGRKCEVRIPKRTEPERKLFVGRLPRGTDEDDLSEYFSKFGSLADVYIPRPPRGFAFVTFEKGEDAESVLKQKHFLKDSPLNVTIPDPPAKKQKFGEHDQYGDRSGGKHFGGGFRQEPPYYPYGQQVGYGGQHGYQYGGGASANVQGLPMQVEDSARAGLDINETELEFLDAFLKKVKSNRKSSQPPPQWN